MPTELSLDDLTALRVLGRGAMGTVFLVKSSDSNSPPFALKVIPKSSIASKPDADRRARWELRLLSRLSHPFLPSLLGSIDSASYLAYALPFCPGGDLNHLRHSLSDRVFSVSAIRFYLSEILLAVSHLHSLHIVYRDLKPENILIQSSGHVVLTDFDLSRHLQAKVSPANPSSSTSPPQAQGKPGGHRHRRDFTRIFHVTDNLRQQLKKVNSARVSPVSRRRSIAREGGEGRGLVGVEKSNSFVGTEEYVAPEIIRGSGHDFAVDWWSLGVVLYEMLYGRTPFRGQNRKETFHRILMKEAELVGERTALRDLIGKLLEKDAEKRVGCEGVKGHEFFRGVDWEEVLTVSRPPFIPSGAGSEEGKEEEEEVDVEKCVGEVFGEVVGTGGTCEEGVRIQQLRSRDFDVF